MNIGLPELVILVLLVVAIGVVARRVTKALGTRDRAELERRRAQGAAPIADPPPREETDGPEEWPTLPPGSSR